jgi:hypothetical protein
MNKNTVVNFCESRLAEKTSQRWLLTVTVGTIAGIAVKILTQNFWFAAATFVITAQVIHMLYHPDRKMSSLLASLRCDGFPEFANSKKMFNPALIEKAYDLYISRDIK